MLQLLDGILNKITMYRLTVYVFLTMIGAAMLFGWLGLLAYSPQMILFSAAYITAVCIMVNAVFAKILSAPVNVESLYITALILVLIISPAQSVTDGAFLELAGWASVWAMASKYMFAIKHKHVFNPAAFGIAVTAFFLGSSASWWVATLPMMPVVLVTGLILIRKIQRFDLVLSFFAVALVAIIIPHFNPATLAVTVWRIVVDVPLLFFAFAMLSEPLTTPPTRARRILYGGLTGLFFAPWMHIGSVFSTPELALLAGNILSYLLSPKQKLILTLQKKIEVAKDTYDFWFTADKAMRFVPGQYLEWTLPHKRSDNRGNKRYFTISSAPTEKGIAMGVKFNKNGSSYKKKLLAMKPGDTMVAGQLSGDFTMPRNTKTKLAFIAGGIGVTPFRSMIHSVMDNREKDRSIVLLYANRHAEDIVYKDVFDRALVKQGIKTVYTLTDKASVPKGWQGKTGYVDEVMIREELPDYAERHFYLSGPQSMIDGVIQALKNLGIPNSHIETDFFPGFA